MNFELLTSNAFFLEKIAKEFKDEKNIGDNVVTTLDVDLQEAAYDALGSSKGQLWCWSRILVKSLQWYLSRILIRAVCQTENWESLNTNERSSLKPCYPGTIYVPGSTFKIVTALEYMRENPDVSSYSYNCTGEIDSGSNTIHCFGGKVHGTVDFRDSLAYSCNTSFSIWDRNWM